MSICQPTTNDDELDMPALRERYRLEAEKRRRSDGDRQYHQVEKDFADFYEIDPHAPISDRAPICEDTDVAVLGGGFAGLIAGAQLKQSGVQNLRIIEMGGDFGGAWYWNRYPGIQCDVESYSYLPLLEELNYVPKERYSFGPEIFQHCQQIGRHFDLYRHAMFGTIVRSIRWDEEGRRWSIATNRGDEIRARFMIMGAGYVNRPKLPGIAGIHDFKGRSFHTSRWDYGYTGGDSFGGLTGLADKRVAIIGTGATGIQCIPFVAKDAQQLYVFQRTPSYVDERGNQPTDPAWAASLRPGWQSARQRAFHVGANEGFAPGEEDLICDGWSEINRNVAAKLAAIGNPTLTAEEMTQLRELEDYRAMERIRRRVDETVRDPKTAARLKAWYRFNCKRPCFNDDFLPAFNRPNVTLVDVSESKGVERVTEGGIVANGVEYPVDCIIYASGFEITQDLRKRFGIATIEGRGGLSLYDHWGKGLKSLYGITTHGFPNFFYMGFGQGAVSGSVTLGYQLQASHIAYIVRETLDRGATAFEPSPEAIAGWNKVIQDNLVFDEQFFNDCTPGYFNNEGGNVDRNSVYGDSFGGGYYAFEKILNDWKDEGHMRGLVLST